MNICQRFLSLFLVVLLALCLVACGGTDNPGTGDLVPDDTTETASTEAAPAGGDSRLPDNELSQQLPEIPFTITEVVFYDLESPMIVYFEDTTYDGGVAYVEALKENGFTQNEITTYDDGASLAWAANKDDHFGISFSVKDGGTGELTINMY